MAWGGSLALTSRRCAVADSPPPELRWRYFGECLVPLVPELPSLKLIHMLSSGFDEYIAAADVVSRRR